MSIWIQQFRNVFKMNMKKNRMNQIEFQWISKRLIGYTFAIDLHFSHRICDARNDSSLKHLLWNMATCLSECGFIGGLNELMTNNPVPKPNACTFSFASLFQACREELNMNLNLMDAFDLCTNYLTLVAMKTVEAICPKIFRILQTVVCNAKEVSQFRNWIFAWFALFISAADKLLRPVI